MAVRKVISQMVECLLTGSVRAQVKVKGDYRTLVFCMRRTRGDSVKATKEVENNISRLETSPSRDSDCLLKGSVVYMRYPFEVPGEYGQRSTSLCSRFTYRHLDGCGLG